MARPRSVHILLGKRTTSTSVRPLLTARLMIAAARFIRSSSLTPVGLLRRSTNCFFSSSAAFRRRMYSAAFSASISALFFRQSTADGRMPSTAVVMASVSCPSGSTISVDVVIAAIDVESFSGNQPRGVVGQKCCRHADVVDADQAACRRLGLRFIEELIEFGNSGRGACRERSGRNSMNTDALRTELGGHITNGALERSLGDA